MKLSICVSFLAAFAASTFAAEELRTGKVQTGRMSTVQLLATGRGAGSAPDAMRFLFMVTRTPGTEGQFTIKETRDFLIGGLSYQEKTQAELGRRIEPSTVIDSAEGFFAKQPGSRRLAPENIADAQIIALTIAGASLPPGAAGEVKLSVGFNKEVEPFTFAFNVPGTNAGANAPAAREAAPRMTAGVPAAPEEGRTRYVAADGVGFAPWTFDLKMTDAAVTGAIYQHNSDQSGMATRLTGPFEITDGKVEGKILTFQARTPGGERVVTFTGEVLGDEIRFKRSVEVKPGADAGLNGILGGGGATQFVAKRSAP